MITTYSDRQKLEDLLRDLSQSKVHPVNTYIRVWINRLRIPALYDVGDIIHESYPIALQMIERGEQRECWIGTFKKISFNVMRDKNKKHKSEENYISTQKRVPFDQHNTLSSNVPLQYGEILDKIGIQSPKDRIILILKSQNLPWTEIAQELVLRGYEQEDFGLVERTKKYGNRLTAKLRGRISPEDFE
jgi:hypothetical protein